MNEELKNKGWSQMKNMLDREMPVQNTGRVVFPWIRTGVTVVLLLAAGMVFMGLPYYQNYELTTDSTEGEAPIKDVGPPVTHLDKETTEEELMGGVNENAPSDNLREIPSETPHNRVNDEIPSTSPPTASSNYNGMASSLSAGGEKSEESVEKKSVNDVLYSPNATLPEGETHSQQSSFVNVLPSSGLTPFSLSDTEIRVNPGVFPVDEKEGESQTLVTNEGLNCQSGLQLGLSWKKPSVHSLHGLGFYIGWEKRWEQSALTVSSGLTKYGWFESSGTIVFHESAGWDESGSELSDLRENADKLINNYLEVDLEIAWRYYLIPKLSVGPQLRLSRVFEAKFKAGERAGLNSELYNVVGSQNFGQAVVNPYQLSTGLVMAYDFNCRWSVEFHYDRHLNHFWKAEESRKNGKGYTLGLGVNMSLKGSR